MPCHSAFHHSRRSHAHPHNLSSLTASVGWTSGCESRLEITRTNNVSLIVDLYIYIFFYCLSRLDLNPSITLPLMLSIPLTPFSPPYFLFFALCSLFPHYLSFSLTYLSLSPSGQISLLSLLHCLYWLPSEVNGFLKHLDRNAERLSHLAPPLAFLPSTALLFLLFHSFISLIIDPLGRRSFQSSNAGPPGLRVILIWVQVSRADRDVVRLD